MPRYVIEHNLPEGLGAEDIDAGRALDRQPPRDRPQEVALRVRGTVCRRGARVRTSGAEPVRRRHRGSTRRPAALRRLATVSARRTCRWAPRSAVAVSLAMVSASLAGGASPALAAFPGTDGLIAYSALRPGSDPYSPGNRDIFTVDPRSGAVVRVTTDPAEDSDPSWSPDGTRIAFTSTRDGASRVYVMNADGTGVRRLTNDARPGFEPTWSPDGTRVAYAHAPNETSDIDIWVQDASDPSIPPVPITSGAYVDRTPVWSPGGRTIAFSSDRGNPGGPLTVWLVDVDGSSPRELVGTVSGYPDWSPDGARVVFSIRTGDAEVGLHLASPGVPGTTPLTGGQGYDLEPAWSPGGTRVVFTRGSDLWVIDDVRSPAPRLLLTDGTATDPDWQPLQGGRPPGGGGPGGGGSGVAATNGRIAFIRGGEVWVMQNDGSGERPVTSGSHPARDPAWSPFGRRGQLIAFVRGDDLFLVDPDARPASGGPPGRGLLPIMRGFSHGAHPTWAPDGRRIAWETNDRRNRTPGIYVVAFGRTAGRPIRVSGSGTGQMPAWSPEPNKIAFVQLGLGTCLLFPSNHSRACPPGDPSLVDGASTIPQLAPLIATWEPDWHPDGDSLVVTARAQGAPAPSRQSATFRHSFVAGAGAALPQLGRAGRNEPDISPDGELLAFSTDRGQIAVGSLTDGATPWTALARGSSPDWQPLPSACCFGQGSGVSGRSRGNTKNLVKVVVHNSNGFPVSGRGSTRRGSRVVRPRGSAAAQRRRGSAVTTFKVPARARRMIPLRLPRAVRARLRRGRRARVVVVLRLRDPAGARRAVRFIAPVRPRP